MDTQSFQPGPPLSHFVRSFWVHQDESRSLRRDRALPSGTSQLIIDLSGNGLQGPNRSAASRAQDHLWGLFNGPDTTYTSFETDRPVYQVGVDFKPGGAYPFFAPPDSELQNAHAPLEALWGTQARELWDRLQEPQSAQARCRALEQALLAHAVRPLERRPAVTYALRAFMHAPRPSSIAQVADQVALSHARFIQVFRDEVGMTPKQYCRVRRFIRVALRIAQVEHVGWAEVALACGYYDQAHLANEFQHFAGVSPSVFLRDRNSLYPTRYLLPPDQGARHAARESREGSASAGAAAGSNAFMRAEDKA
jgi:AraC-like DNA-binding protein